MKKRFILLDIDNTLYDTRSFRKKLFANIASLLAQNNVADPEEVSEKIHKEMMEKNGIFYPEEFVKALAERFSFGENTQDALLDIMYDQAEVPAYLYDETIEIVKTFASIGEIGIFSQGMERFQKMKLEKIAHMFHNDHVHIVRQKLSELAGVFEKYKEYEVFFLDDALPVLHAVKKEYAAVFTIWVKRGRHAESQLPITDFTPDATVMNLTEAKDIIEKQ